MGIALQKLSENERQVIAAGSFVVRTVYETKGEQHGLCPFHDENNPSFSYSFKKDVYCCQTCGETGDLVNLWGHVKGVPDADQFKEFCLVHGIELGKAGPGRKKRYKSGNAVDPGAIDSGQDQQAQDAPVIDEAAWARMRPLPDGMRAMLRERRGWTDQAMDKLDLRLQTVYPDKSGKIREVTRAERIAIPVRDDAGALRNVRNYKPGATEGKIMSWAPGYGTARLFPAGTQLAPAGPVYLCEGEPDTICAISHGLNAITQTSKTTTWSDEQLGPFRGRDVVILYDADAAGVKYAVSAARELARVAASVRVLEWPDYMGRQPDGTWPEKHGQDLTDFFVKHKRTLDEFRELVAAARTCEAQPEPDEALTDSGSQFFRQNESTGRWTFIPRWLADRIVKDIELMYHPATTILSKWNGRHWEEYHEDNLKKICINYLGDEAKMQRINDAVAQAVLLSSIQHGREPNDRIDWLCLQNVMLDISKLDGERFVTKPHDKTFYSTYALNVSLEENVIPCDRWLQFLGETIQTPEAIMQAQEFAGYCLSRETRYNKCLFLLGPGADGKSTFLKILRKLVGEQNCAAVAFSDMEDQFYRSALHNKLLNISTEVGSAAMESMYFKAITSGDTISAAFKNRSPFEFTPFCKLAFSANKLPRVKDNSDGFFRRVLPISFKRQFFGTDDDKWLETKLEAELSGIFQWALAGLYRLRTQNGFTWCDETDDLLQDYKRENNPVLCFVEDECVLGERCEVVKDGLYKSYVDYCRRSGYREYSKVHFFRELAIVRKGLKEIKPVKEGERIRYLTGICLRALESGEK